MNHRDYFRDVLSNVLQVKVTPKASSNRLLFELQDDGGMLVKAYVTLVPEDGQVNKELIKMLAKELKLSPSSLEIIRGLKCRNKTIRFNKV